MPRIRGSAARNAAAFAQMLGWIDEGRLKPYVSKRYALADTPHALADMAARSVTGKIVIEM